MNNVKPSLTLYSFNDMWHPALLLLLILIAVCYVFVTGRWRGRFPNSTPATRSQQFYFFSGLFLYYAVQGSPWKVVGEYLFSAHMITMTISYLCVPPLILLGIPKWFWKPVLNMPVMYKILKTFTKPFFAVVFFNALFSFVHLPLVFNYIMSHMYWMPVTNGVLLLTGFFMWWPVITPLPEMRQLSYLMKMGYLFADGMLLTPACALLAFSNHMAYDAYSNVPQLVWFMTPEWDQQAAGVFMKVIQEITYGIALCIVIYKWITTERKRGVKEDPYTTSAMGRTMRTMPSTGKK
ncbi:MAG TPA: cytochrome c oxidase assembly protein [Bacillales bacterium]|nr:cytochrome c oxidase assembly protein [Bacillales bacterium]